MKVKGLHDSGCEADIIMAGTISCETISFQPIDKAMDAPRNDAIPYDKAMDAPRNDAIPYDKAMDAPRKPNQDS